MKFRKIHPKHHAHIRRHLKALVKVRKKQHHPLQHHVHKKYGISKKTLFYVKEYGPHSNVTMRIIKESIKMLLLASLISSLGGLAFEDIKVLFVAIIPLVILMPALNNMIGSYGSIISSKFSTMLHEGKAQKKEWWALKGMKRLFIQLMVISAITASVCAGVSVAASYVMGHAVDASLASKVFLIAVLDTTILVSVLFSVAVFAGLYFYMKGEDPNNFLIPITTSIADFGNMVILAVLVLIFF